MLSSVGAALSLVRAEVARTPRGSTSNGDGRRGRARLASSARPSAPASRPAPRRGTVASRPPTSRDEGVVRAVATGAVALEAGAAGRRRVGEPGERLAAAAAALAIERRRSSSPLAASDFYRVYVRERAATVRAAGRASSTGSGACRSPSDRAVVVAGARPTFVSGARRGGRGCVDQPRGRLDAAPGVAALRAADARPLRRAPRRRDPARGRARVADHRARRPRCSPARMSLYRRGRAEPRTHGRDRVAVAALLGGVARLRDRPRRRRRTRPCRADRRRPRAARPALSSLELVAIEYAQGAGERDRRRRRPSRGGADDAELGRARSRAPRPHRAGSRGASTRERPLERSRTRSPAGAAAAEVAERWPRPADAARREAAQAASSRPVRRVGRRLVQSDRCGSCSPTTTESGPRGCRRCAARCSSSTGIEVDVIAPDSNRSATARSITTRSPLWVEEVEFDDGTTRLRDRRHAGRLRPLRRPRPARRQARPDRLRDQPRLQPRRRRHLLGHGRGGVRGDRPRPPRDRGLPAVGRHARWTSARAASSTSASRRAFAARARPRVIDEPACRTGR